MELTKPEFFMIAGNFLVLGVLAQVFASPLVVCFISNRRIDRWLVRFTLALVYASVLLHLFVQANNHVLKMRKENARPSVGWGDYADNRTR